MKKNPSGYMTTLKERLSYWSYFIGQNIYYNITAAFLMAAAFIADIIIYSHTGCRLSYTHLLQFIDTPEKILTSLTIGYLFTRFALTVATTTLFTLLLHKAFGHQI